MIRQLKLAIILALTAVMPAMAYSYPIEVPEIEHGSITSDVQSAQVGDTVTLTVTHDPGYLMKDLCVVAGYPVDGGGEAHAPVVPKTANMWYQQQVISLTKVDENTYQFVLPEQFNDLLTPNYLETTSFRVRCTVKQVSPAVLWSAGEKTLYFIYEENPVCDYEDTKYWQGHNLNKVWAGGQILATGWNHPDWSSNDEVNSNLEKVVFDESFAQVRPTSCYEWFLLMYRLTTIEGLENLNTSEVTNMNSMFYECSSLSTLNLDSFDVSKVTNTTTMFRNCSSLTRIFCDQTWNINTSEFMFDGSVNLVGAVPFDSTLYDGSMANPNTGYFTGRKSINTDVQGNGTINVIDREFPTFTVTFTLDEAQFTTTENVVITGDNSGDTIEFTLSNGVYSFVMPDEPVTITVTFDTLEGVVPAVFWCEDNATLYFVNVPFEAVSDGKWDGHTITQAWNGDVVTNTGTTEPGWRILMEKVTKVVIDDSFAQLRPTSCYAWFSRMLNLNTIEGLENLNTSEVTNMYSMFFACSSLSTLDLNSFDVSNVNDVTDMFQNCTSLTTIYCDNTWEIPTMFFGCNNLVGAVPFNVSQINCAMANPVTGYFTGKWDVSIAGDIEHGTVTCEKDWAYTNEVVTLTVNPDEGYRLESITVETVADGQPGRAPGKAPQRVNIDVNMGESPGIYTFTMPAAKVIVNATFEKESITEIDAIQADTEGDGLWYTLDGRVLRDKPITPGIYLHGKSKIRIR